MHGAGASPALFLCGTAFAAAHRRNESNVMRYRLLLILAALVLHGCGDFPSTRKAPKGPAPESAPAAAPADAASSPKAQATGLPDFTVLVDKVGPAVVNVVTTRKGRAGAAGATDDPLFEFFRRFMPNPPDTDPDTPGEGLGSGFITSPDGYILTNAHVVAEADDVTIRLADAREFKAKVIGSDKRTDIALLKVSASGLPTVTPGSSETLKVGEWVAAIGSPFGFVNTITAGIVSAKGRSLPDETFVPFIQTDVAVNPGNSGGPLLNLRGEVVGINSAIYSRTGGYMGVSFAIPIEVALDVAKQLRETGKVTRGRLGVQIQALTAELAKSFKLDNTNGVLVASVEPKSPADKAGIQPGDVILSFNGNPVKSAIELPRIVAATRPGTRVTLEILRGGAKRQIQATLAEFPSETPAKAEAPESPKSSGRLGLAVRELAAAQRKSLGIDYGLVVENVSAAQASQIQRGDIILAINNRYFKSIDEFNKIVQQQPAGSIVALLIRRGDAALYIPVRVGEGK
jgi:serine protease Do